MGFFIGGENMWMIITIAVSLVLITLLSLHLEQYKKEVRTLSTALVKEKRKRNIPVLTLDMDWDKRALHILNDSYCYAKNIVFEEVKLIISIGFQKHLNLCFNSIELLKPGERTALSFKVFDHGHNITSADSPNLVYYFPDTKLTFRIHYQNIEKDNFTTTIVNEGKQFTVEAANPLDEEPQDLRDSEKKILKG